MLSGIFSAAALLGEFQGPTCSQAGGGGDPRNIHRDRQLKPRQSRGSGLGSNPRDRCEMATRRWKEVQMIVRSCSGASTEGEPLGRGKSEQGKPARKWQGSGQSRDDGKHGTGRNLKSRRPRHGNAIGGSIFSRAYFIQAAPTGSLMPDSAQTVTAIRYSAANAQTSRS